MLLYNVASKVASCKKYSNKRSEISIKLNKMFEIKKAKIDFDNKIGEGRFGDVYPYGSKNTKNVVKCLTTKRETELISFIQEITLSFGHNHPRIVPCRGYSISFDRPTWEIYIKMPKMETSLFDNLQLRKKKQEYFTKEQLLNHFYELCHALDDLHLKGIAHRDLQPKNILLDEKGNMYISDIGCASFVPIEEMSTTVNNLQIGVISYLAPECRRKLTKKEYFLADSWSLGLLFLEMCTLEKLEINMFSSEEEIKKLIGSRLEKVLNAYGEEIAKIIAVMTDLDSKQRWTPGRVYLYIKEKFSDILKNKFYSRAEIEDLAIDFDQLQKKYKLLQEENKKLKAELAKVFEKGGVDEASQTDMQLLSFQSAQSNYSDPEQSTSVITPEGIYYGEMQHGMRDGKGEFHYYIGDRYIGEWKSDMKHGAGQEIYCHGDRYIGEWFENKKHGRGEYHFANGSTYIGEFKDDQRTGEGEFIRPDSGRYVGSFLNGQFHGRGEYTYENEERYVGEWKEGKRHGKGEFYYANGNKYIGEWEEGICSGMGELHYANGEKYIGMFRNGKPDGKGEYHYANGDRYIGEWKDGKSSGQGKYIYADGETSTGEFKRGSDHSTPFERGFYDGQFKDGKRDGYGERLYPNGARYKGEWKNGKKEGKGEHTWPNGASYKGEFKDDKKHGKGEYIYPNGERYIGDWVDDKKHGYGEYIYANGDRYVGEWKEGKRDGKGEITRANGQKYSGNWKDDKPTQCNIF